MPLLRCIPVLFALTLSACIIHISDEGGGDWDWAQSNRLHGSGVRSTQTRTCEGFRRVRTALSANVHVMVGEASRVELSCDDNLLEHVRTRVIDGELVIDTDGTSLRFRESPRIEISCPALEAGTLSGSGALKIEGLAGERFEASLSGSGEFSARGKVAHASLSVTGSGDLDCRDLLAQEAQVSVSGSGNVRVRASERLSVSISGSGDVRYSGEPPQVTRSIAGSGTIAPE